MAKPLEIRFMSSNPHKITEAQAILSVVDVEVVPVSYKIDELQTIDVDKLVRDKLLKAFHHFGKPLFVEHTGLFLSYLNGFPGGLTQIFWDTLQADRFGELFGPSAGDNRVTARTTVAYCDGMSVYLFHGECEGEVVSPPRGPADFQWDCVFQPDGETRTFAEMGPDKNRVSMRRKALDQFAAYLTGRTGR